MLYACLWGGSIAGLGGQREGQTVIGRMGCGTLLTQHTLHKFDCLALTFCQLYSNDVFLRPDDHDRTRQAAAMAMEVIQTIPAAHEDALAGIAYNPINKQVYTCAEGDKAIKVSLREEE